ncbi:hypothetical protein HBI56_078510 [Parastagonospora nodorum]|uniref:Uncharacterized protein n=2 Tax=Phaeosphaeria nodorum (strain SN15 / ATCC MYA-4574 / FGSC 10173) TaxID=321614 RepID=A0A7U2HW51_PHANO|nr:hypothetical protein SNOG_07405 [Parastagonospora nodorum SN15]KAH3910212.1 hypothetical protein HBH56_148670 [Parastagonospora nodorum]EAT84871.2 hypothetical protein SNOG_07405 [Parastagonospora nodorum SN15]KAH3923169.1 hypothetical protein HBH54_213310 [Parastagonospora nodorum]KAH3946123.1 hypothetical protein HBH53_136120 [Parastagonospora nodorum]KAH3983907.1 hypothetical protein HBH52_063890 [Parastagonospora nodorum]
MATTQQAVRRWIMTGGVAAVTITGTIYGATLKEDVTVQKEKKRILQATPEERIAQLEFSRADLVAKKHEMELKIAKHHERVKAKEQAKVEGSK